MERGVPTGGLRTLVNVAESLDVTTAALAVAYLDAGEDAALSGRERDRRRIGAFRSVSDGGAAAMGIALRELRVGRGLTLRGAAMRGGVAVAYMSSVEHGAVASPELATIRKIAACSTTTDEDLCTEFTLAVLTYAGEVPPPHKSIKQVGRPNRR